MLARSRSACACALACLALIVFAAPAAWGAPPYDWPVNGAPVNDQAGDQHRLFATATGCNVMSVWYVDSRPGADSLLTVTLGALPPNGVPRAYPLPVNATGVTEVSAVAVHSGQIEIPFPYCLGPPTMAEVWLEGAGAASEIVVHDPVWPTARVVADDGPVVRHHPRMAPSGVADPDTALVVVWSDDLMGAPQIRAQRVTRSGLRTWGATGILVAFTGAPQTEPEISRLQDGSSLVVWLDARSGGSDVYAMRLLPDGTPAPGWPEGGLALEDRPEISASLRLVEVDPNGGDRFVVWEESGARFGGGRSIVTRRLYADGMPEYFDDPLGVVLTSSLTVEHLQDVTPLGEGFVAVWTDTRSATPANPTDLYAQKLVVNGGYVLGWPASGLPICTATGRQDAARVSAGNAYPSAYLAFAWEDRRGPDADVYTEMRYVDGTLPPGHWLADGLPATSAPGEQTAPVVGAGNSGGCFVAWEDARDVATTGLDIYAQAFSSEGEKLDVPPGAPGVFLLGSPRPNPMRNTTVLTLQSPRGGTLRIEVLDVAGRRVRTLAAGEFAAGTHEIAFDGRDDAGRALPAGVYRVRARVGDAISSRTLIRVH